MNLTVARVLQRYVANFAIRGDPNANGLPRFPKWTTQHASALGGGTVALAGANVVNLTVRGFPVGKEPAVERCAWWLRNAFAGSNGCDGVAYDCSE